VPEFLLAMKRSLEQPDFNRPRLKRTIEPVDAPNGDIILMRAIADDIRIQCPSQEERALLRALDGENSISELSTQFGRETVAKTISQMERLSLLEDASDDETVPEKERERFDRQLRYFSEVSRDRTIPSECQRRLREARVAVLGVGGLGGRVAWELACCGIGELRLFDGDLVEVSNLDRQIQFAEADLGKRKVDVTAATLRAFNSAVRVDARFGRIESETELEECITGCDLVIDAADWPAHEIEFWCNSACFAGGIPYIAMSQIPPLARVGPLYVPGRTGCYACQDIRYRREYPLYDVAIDQRRAKSSPAASLGPLCGLIGGFVGMEAMHFLTGLVEPATLGIGFTFDLRTLETEREEIVPEPDCPVCRGLQTGTPA
jgi:bacteriocin biosynthesis cyclodehydratase domain-containing protein